MTLVPVNRWEDLARSLNPIIRGWINYYSALPAILLISVLRHIESGSIDHFLSDGVLEKDQ